MSEKFLFLDTETTGLREPRLVSLAYSVEGESMINYGLFKPPKPIEHEASSANHITDEMVKNAPDFQTSPDFQKLQTLLDTHTLVAHYAVFDAKVLQNEGLNVKKVLCTCELAKRAVPQASNFKLQYLRYFLSLNCDATAHNSLGDVIVLKALFKRLTELSPHLFPQYAPTPASKIQIPTTLTA